MCFFAWCVCVLCLCMIHNVCVCARQVAAVVTVVSLRSCHKHHALGPRVLPTSEPHE